MLSQLIRSDLGTDKDTSHSYLSAYEELFKHRKYSTRKVLEIGIGDFDVVHNGSSLKLWRDYFPNATVYGIDILSLQDIRILPELITDPRVVLFAETNAYCLDTVEKYFSNIRFDIIIDDGSHQLEHLKLFLLLYLPLLSDGGIIIIEDVQDIDWVNELRRSVPQTMQFGYYDLRPIKNKYDDILIVIHKPESICTGIRDNADTH
jgi:8-demethyl-8-alpha-L-rhamnosyltetracenomycin-C 2'-O-methyltransferase